MSLKERDKKHFGIMTQHKTHPEALAKKASNCLWRT